MFSTIGGQMGYLFSNLAFVSAIIATLSFFFHLRKPEKAWEDLGIYSLITHIFSVFGIVGTLFYLIYTHQYQYHYVWSHSSNELPVYYMLACFWEGQEGSFLLWMFWHAVIAIFLIRKSSEWRAGVLAVVSSIQVILSTMILGIVIPALALKIIATLALGLFAYLLFQNTQNKNILYASIALIASMLIHAFGISSVVLPAVLLGFMFFTIQQNYSVSKFTGMNTLYLTGIILTSTLIYFYGIDLWKLGSSPFMLMKDVMTDAPIFASNPTYVPANGSGLNPLLQNYWMVIHPPTLFLGFALTVVPFGFVITGLLKKDYMGWIKPATPWNLFAVMILGIGIIMGGYWAYETLNFGGYWNWDPVENASLVPWIIGVASLHTLVAYRATKTNLKYSIILVIATFLLVLYSTFLTRSGILGEASVHTFTDLGLSGQLLLLLFFYCIGIYFLLSNRWNEIPVVDKTSNFLTKETLLFFGAIILTVAGFEIILSTSLPVLNKILGTKLAPPPNIQFYYYKWNVWFAILFGVLSAIGQFVFWTNIEKEPISKSILKPFLTALTFTFGIVIALLVYDWQFVYNANYEEMISLAEQNGILDLVWAYIKVAILTIGDELMLFSALFTIFANMSIFIRLIRKSKLHLKNVGGSMAHVGFGLMLVGILFSSGYEWIISVNMNPNSLKNFPENAKMDNIPISRSNTKPTLGYNVTYNGKQQAVAPISNLQTIFEDKKVLKISFKDQSGETFALEFPKEFFEQDSAKNAKVEFDKLKTFIEKNIKYVQPKLINNRTKYSLTFASLKDTSDKITLLPEAEINERMGLLAHPDRKIELFKDLYVHVTSVPDDGSDQTMSTKEDHYAIGDTIHLKRGFAVIEKLMRVDDVPEYKDFEVVARVLLKVTQDGKTMEAKPTFFVDKKGMTSAEGADLADFGMKFAFVGADPVKNKLVIRSEEEDWSKDSITFKAIAKPFINLLWLGTFLLSGGFLVAMIRRMREKV